MTANPEDIVAQAHQKFDRLIEIVRSDNPAICLLQTEQAVLDSVLQLGSLAFELLFAMQAPKYVRQSCVDSDGNELRYHSERQGQLQTIFGIVHFSRSYYNGQGKGHYEMDAALNLPAKGPSDFVRIFLERLALSMSYEEATDLVSSYFPVGKSTSCIQDLIVSDSQDAQEYYKQTPTSTVDAAETILVVQGDCKGIPMLRGVEHEDACESGVAQPGKKKDGPKREGKKKMATVVAVATYAPHKRTPDQIVESLFDEKTYVPAPAGHSFKKVWATMQGKQAAIAQSHIFVDQVADAAITDRLLLTDGELALKRQFGDDYPGYKHILDLMHAMGYLWVGADAQFGSGSKEGSQWVRSATLRMLRGDAPGVVEELYGWSETTEKPSKFVPIEKAARYLDGNLGSMRYDEYLARGWPIATGMIEGACRHIVKDRCERSGQRWTMTGVEGMLRLRCVEENGDWDAYHHYRIAQRQRATHGREPEPPQANRSADAYRFETQMSLAAAV